MKRNTYKFSWFDKNGEIKIKYLDNRSQVEAEEDFEKTFGVSLQENKVFVRRVRD